MLNVRQAAERLCVSEVTVHNFHRRGLLKRGVPWLERPLMFTEEEVDMMEKVLDLQEEKIARGESGTDVDKNFHYIMARAAKNKVLLRITDNIIDLLAESREQYLQVEGRPQKSILRHREVLEAIRSGDPELPALAKSRAEDDAPG